MIGLNKLNLVGKAYVVMPFALYYADTLAQAPSGNRPVAKLWQSCTIVADIAFQRGTILAKTRHLDANTGHTLSG